LLLVVVFEAVGLDVHGLVAVCFFGESHLRREDGSQKTEQNVELDFHKGANLALL
jgi:hypothetical protein